MVLNSAVKIWPSMHQEKSPKYKILGGMMRWYMTKTVSERFSGLNPECDRTYGVRGRAWVYTASCAELKVHRTESRAAKGNLIITRLLEESKINLLRKVVKFTHEENQQLTRWEPTLSKKRFLALILLWQNCIIYHLVCKWSHSSALVYDSCCGGGGEAAGC